MRPSSRTARAKVDLARVRAGLRACACKARARVGSAARACTGLRARAPSEGSFKRSQRHFRPPRSSAGSARSSAVALPCHFCVHFGRPLGSRGRLCAHSGHPQGSRGRLCAARNRGCALLAPPLSRSSPLRRCRRLGTVSRTLAAGLFGACAGLSGDAEYPPSGVELFQPGREGHRRGASAFRLLDRLLAVHFGRPFLGRLALHGKGHGSSGLGGQPSPFCCAGALWQLCVQFATSPCTDGLHIAGGVCHFRTRHLIWSSHFKCTVACLCACLIDL